MPQLLRPEAVENLLGEVPNWKLHENSIERTFKFGRFQEAIQYEAEAIRIAETTKHAHTIGWAQLTASKLHLLKGDWAKARDLLEKWINMPGTLDVAILIPWAVTSLAWTLAQIGDASEALSRLREGEEPHDHSGPEERDEEVTLASAPD